jgi:glyoxylase-like metal-dependent hydrolase (beta-lactamase superfamily II)/8-oxo-dGTP pyrophosphatase MutT (NUDIX family)
MTPTPVTPKDAAAMILLRTPEDPEVFWVKRSPRLAFMGGFHAFPGGQRDAEDANVPVRNCDDAVEAAMRVCAVREIFEEAGILIARGVERLTAHRLAELREEMHADRITFADILTQEGLTIDAEMLLDLPRWVTPPPAPKRFNTYFYAAWVPACADGPQLTHVIPGELESGEWNRPQAAFEKWRQGEVLIAPPVFVPIRELALAVNEFRERLFQITPMEQLHLYGMEFRAGFNLVSLRTPTIPPATHTNCYLIGGEEVVVIDPGSPYEDEQQKLDVVIEKLLADGRRVREIIITHLHPDHIGGVMHLSEKFNVPVAAHRLTAEAIANTVRVDRFIEDNEIIVLEGGERDPDLHWRLRALWSPGHARGHLSFYEERTGSLITGDCIVGLGTVVIAPPEGNMKDYLASLERLLELPRLTALFPAHGPVLGNTRGKIEEYIKHRLEREAAILAVLSDVPRTIPEIVAQVYTDVPVAMHKLAALSVQAHLDKLLAEGRAICVAERYCLA